MALWNKLTYPKRLFVWLLAYSLLLVGCFIVFQYHREKQFKIEELNARLQLINIHILDDLAKGGEVSEVTVTQPHPFDELRVSVIGNDGHVIYDNSLDTIPGTNHLEREEIAKALTHGSGYTVRRHSESTGNTYFYSATLGNDGKIVRSAVPYSLSLSELLEADYGFIWAMSGVTIVMCILGFFATRRVGLHILRLNKFAEKAERGERIYDTAPFPKDELGSISNHIVRLYSNLQKAIADRDKEHQAALREQQDKERIKKQLTNNINHELKTPVASIQVCLETLMSHKNMSEEKRDEFLTRCIDNTDRLKRLLNDVSVITRMDDAPQTIAKEPLDLAEIIEEVVTDCEPIALGKGIKIENGIDRSIWLEGNRELLMSVFRNLIDNAVAYSGATKIKIKIFSSEGNKLKISFADNGCGVPEEHLARIFERFYRIDKGRSRRAGGTGLGLSIVKNAVLLHGGSISVHNAIGGGLEFMFDLRVHRKSPLASSWGGNGALNRRTFQSYL